MASSKNKKPKKSSVRRKSDNICNICQEQTELTKDHVPPKTCQKFSQVLIHKLLSDSKTDKGFSPQIGQNGLYYKTICPDCNNNILGGKYDKYLGDFTKNIESLIKSSIMIPGKISVRCYPNAIARSLLGHLLAAKTETDEVVLDQLIRPCVLDETISIPSSINIFYWIYPYKNIKVIRDFAMVSCTNTTRNFGYFNLLKFYPVAFLIAHDLEEYDNLDSLKDFKNMPFDQEAEISIKLNPIRYSNWPEDINNTNRFLLFGQSTFNDSVNVTPR
jgi:hypothetical protein